MHGARDLAVLWHPCTQMREHPDIAAAGADRARRRRLAGRARRPPLPRCGQSAGGPTCSAMPNRASPRRSRARRATLEHVILAGFSHEPRSRWPRRCWRSRRASRARAAGEGVLRRQRLGRRRSRAEDGLPLVPQPRRARSARSSSRWRTATTAKRIGALAVGDIPLYRRVYAPLLAEALFAPSPDAYLARAGRERRPVAPSARPMRCATCSSATPARSAR